MCEKEVLASNGRSEGGDRQNIGLRLFLLLLISVIPQSVLAAGQHRSPSHAASLALTRLQVKQENILKTTKPNKTCPMTPQSQIHSTVPPSEVLVSEAREGGWHQCPQERDRRGTRVRTAQGRLGCGVMPRSIPAGSLHSCSLLRDGDPKLLVGGCAPIP